MSCRWGYLDDNELLDRLKKIAYGTINTITLGAEEYSKALTSEQKQMMIKGVIALICDISDSMDEEREKHGAANS